MINKEIEYIIAEFIFNVFETFKGWICPNIDTRILCSYRVKVATCSNDTLYINIDDILNKHINSINNYEEYILNTKRFVLEVIIHELYHVEQDSINLYYSMDENYKLQKEAEVIYMSLIFLLKNSYYIYQTFGITLDEQRIRTRIEETVNSGYFQMYDRMIYDDSNTFCLNTLNALIVKGMNDNRSYYIDFIEKTIGNIANVIVFINKDKYVLKNDFIYNNNYNELNTLYKYISSNSLIGEVKTELLHSEEYNAYVVKVKDNSLKSLFTKLKED